MFKKLENNRPFLKMAFEGFAGDGKTYTAALLAVGLHKKIGSKKPIAIFDTEKAAKALLPLFTAEKIDVVVSDEQRSLAALNQAIKWCEDGNSDILLIDSITHVWEDYLQSYMQQKRRSRLEFQDWGIIKPQWKNQFSTPFVKANVHIIFTGRAGYEYTDEKNEETGKREIFKSGIKMKAETETAFEPDILVLMEKHMDLIGAKKSVWREATVIKDRTANIDGKSFKNPTYEDFRPAIEVLLDGKVSTQSQAEIKDRFEDMEGKNFENKKRREIAISEIEGTFQLMKIGTSAADKQFKAAILNKVFSVVSVDALDRTPLAMVDTGMNTIKLFSEKYLTYLENCAESQTPPEMKQIGELLDETIAANLLKDEVLI